MYEKIWNIFLLLDFKQAVEIAVKEQDQLTNNVWGK